ncbi:MAG: MBL fold metallo-hydrolase [Dehalococcoidales bacterium]|nr:MBL fold metallo-hydrolase [Dehalococcoidales bacterium]
MAVAVKDESIQIEKLSLGPYGTNTYILTCLKTNECAVVDAPGEPDTLMEYLKDKNPKYILMTHNHMDHTMSLVELREKLGVPVVAHEADSDEFPLTPDIYLNDGDILDIGEIKLKVIHTPGHTPGCICFLAGKYLISGDTIFDGGPGKSWSGKELKQILESITTKIFTLPDDTQIFPGHGNSTVLKKEKAEYEVFAAKPHKAGLHGDIVWLKS